MKADRDSPRSRSLDELRRAGRLAADLSAADPGPPWAELLAALRSVPAVIEDFEALHRSLEQAEAQRDEILERLITVETALRSAHEARDDAFLALAELREIVVGSTPCSPRDLVEAVRRLRERSA